MREELWTWALEWIHDGGVGKGELWGLIVRV